MPAVHINKLHTFTGHRDSVYTLEQSNEEHLFFSGAGDGMIALWDLTLPDKGERIAQLPHSVYALHFHTGSGLLIAGHNYEGIHVLDWHQKKEVGSLKLSPAPIFDIQSFGNMIFVACGNGTIYQVDLQRLTIVNTVQPTNKNIRTIAINKKSGEMAVGSSDHFIRLYDLDDLSLKKEWKAHANSVFTLRYAPNQQYLISGSRDARLNVWDSTHGYSHAKEVVAHLYAINHIEFSPDAKHFVTCSMDKSIKVWDAEDIKLVKVIDRARHAGHSTSVNKLLWTTFNDQLVSASDDRTISVWNIIF